MGGKKGISPFQKWSHFLGVNLLLSFAFLILFWSEVFNSLFEAVLALSWMMTIFITQWIGNAYISMYLDKKISRLHQPLTRAMWGVFCLVLFSMFAFAIVQTFVYFTFNIGLQSNYLAWLWAQMMFLIPISFTVLIFINFVNYYKEWRMSELQSREMEAEMLRYKYQVLKNQINPHFLFNSFNVLIDLVTEDPSKSIEFIHKMSNLYRIVLESKDKKLISLDEEINFLNNYIFLLNIRFEDKLSITNEIDNNSDGMIIPMSLQLLIENVVKHNRATSKDQLRITLRRVENYIHIINNIQVKSSNWPSTKIGLENLKQQYSYFTESKISYGEENGNYVVKIPLIMESPGLS